MTAVGSTLVGVAGQVGAVTRAGVRRGRGVAVLLVALAVVALGLQGGSGDRLVPLDGRVEGGASKLAARALGPRPARSLGPLQELPDPVTLRWEGPKPYQAPPPPGEGLVAFEGLSTWVDNYDTQLTPQQQVAVAAAGGVDTLFVQASRETSEGHVHDPARLAALIEGAHDHGMRVMVWTVPRFTNVAHDLTRAKAAIAFTTPRGDRPDAFGLDIETEHVADVGERTRRLLLLSDQLREWVGPDYPLGAIVLPPRQLERNVGWWPGFPYAELAERYDVMVPMSYSSYRGQDAATTHQWNHDNVVLVRQLSGDPDIPVHLAGGIADDLPEVGWFVAAADAAGVIGAGLYDLHTTPPEAWPQLRPLSRRLATPTVGD